MTVQLNDNGQSAYENRLRSAWKRKRPGRDGITHNVIPDGEVVAVPTLLMDSEQRAVSGAASAVQDNAEANQSQLAAVKDHDRAVQKWADYFSGQHDGREHIEQSTDNGQSRYESRLADAWKNPATIGG